MTKDELYDLYFDTRAENEDLKAENKKLKALVSPCEQMSDAIKTLRDYLAKSPSVVYPEDVLAYIPAIEVENAKLRVLASGLWDSIDSVCLDGECATKLRFVPLMRELGLEAML